MRVGANYTPRRGWFHSWLDFDEREVAADFEALASIGLDHVRLFPLWPLLQPSRSVISKTQLTALLRTVELAGEAGLQASVDVLNGHLSSFDFLPSWLVTWHDRNLFTDPDVVAAQEHLVEVVAGELSSRPNATGICLGNEFPQFAKPEHPHPNALDVAAADAWLTRLLGAAQRAWPEGRHVHCFDDTVWFLDELAFTPEHAVAHGASTTVHSWVFGGLGQRLGIDDPGLAGFARYLVELADAWAGHQTRPIWLQEVGAPCNFVTEQQAPVFLRETLAAVLDAPRLEAVTWWCSHDVSRSLPDFPELEYSLGLLDSEGRVKPVGRQLAEMVPDLRSARPTTADRPELAFEAAASRRSLTAVDGELFTIWLEHFRQGERPRLVATSGAAGRLG